MIIKEVLSNLLSRKNEANVGQSTTREMKGRKTVNL